MFQRYSAFAAVLLMFGFAETHTHAAMATKGVVPRDSAAPTPQAASTPQDAPALKTATATASPQASPAPEAKASRPSPESLISCVGRVIYASGAEIVAEIDGGAKAGERLDLIDDRDRKRGEVKVQLPLDKVLYAIAGTSGEGPSVGHRLARPK